VTVVGAPLESLAHVAPGSSLTRWSFEPTVAAALVLTGLLYADGLGRVRRLGRRFSRRRAASFFAGLVVLFFALEGPIDADADLLLSVHMVQHLLITLVAAPLLLLGTPVILALQASSERTRRRWLLPLVHGRTGRVLGRPAVGWAAFVVVLWGSHLSTVYEAAVRNQPIHALEHLAYLVSALLFWRPIIGLEPGGRLSHGARVLSIFLAMPAMALLGLAISTAPRVLYPTYLAGARALGVSALSDQHLAGALMWEAGMFVFVPALALVVLDWMRRDEERARRLDERAAARTLLQPRGGG
jgi:putative copper resistance protein D